MPPLVARSLEMALISFLFVFHFPCFPPLHLPLMLQKMTRMGIFPHVFPSLNPAQFKFLPSEALYQMLA